MWDFPWKGQIATRWTSTLHCTWHKDVAAANVVNAWWFNQGFLNQIRKCMYVSCMYVCMYVCVYVHNASIFGLPLSCCVLCGFRPFAESYAHLERNVEHDGKPINITSWYIIFCVQFVYRNELVKSISKLRSCTKVHTVEHNPSNTCILWYETKINKIFVCVSYLMDHLC